jgi:hypothetical protein
MIPAGVRQMDRQDDFDDAEDRNGTTRASPTYLKVGTVLTAVNDAGAGCAGGLRPSLTAAPRGAGGIPVGTKKRPPVKQRN